MTISSREAIAECREFAISRNRLINSGAETVVLTRRDGRVGKITFTEKSFQSRFFNVLQYTDNPFFPKLYHLRRASGSSYAIMERLIQLSFATEEPKSVIYKSLEQIFGDNSELAVEMVGIRDTAVHTLCAILRKILVDKDLELSDLAVSRDFVNAINILEEIVDNSGALRWDIHPGNIMGRRAKDGYQFVFNDLAYNPFV